MALFNNLLIKPGFFEVYIDPMKSGKAKRISNRIDKLKFIGSCNYIFIKFEVEGNIFRNILQFLSLIYIPSRRNIPSDL